MSDFENILVSQEGRVKVVQLNRPKALNALNMPLMLEVLSVLSGRGPGRDGGLYRAQGVGEGLCSRG